MKTKAARRKARQLENAFNRLEGRHGRAASDEEVATEMSIDMRDYFHLLEDVRGATLLSLDEHCSSDDSNSPNRIHDTVQDHSHVDPIAMLEVQKMRKVLDDSLDHLPERERLVLILYYYEEMTLKEIGAILGVSEARVSQIHTKAIGRLRGKLRPNQEILASARTEHQAISRVDTDREQHKRVYARAALGIA